MSLADYKPAKRTVAYPGGEFEVRALSLLDISILVEAHRYAVDQIALSVRAGKEVAFSDERIMAEIVMECIRESPTLVAHIIALCSDEPSQQEMALALPATVQTEALLTIADMTFKDTAAIKKLAADVMKLIRGILPPTIVPLAAE